MKLSWFRQTLVCRHPFATAHGIEPPKETIVVAIEHEGVVGYGEAIPTALYGQSLKSAEATLSAAGDLLGGDPFAIEPTVDRLLERFDDQRATVCAIDAALHDWVGKRLETPTWRLLGVDPAAMPITSFTIGVDDLDAIETKVREADAYPTLKVKIGTDQEEQILSIVRRLAPDKTVRVDANTGWSADDADARLRRAAEYGVEFVEQPVPVDDHETLKRLTAADVVPIIVDESAIVPADVAPLAGRVDGINIKLCKAGGIREAYRMIAIARSLGMRVMLGCMIESSLGIAAAAQLAPLVDYIDLDGHLLLASDPYDGIGGARGRLTLTERPGLGVAPRVSLA